MDRRSVLAGAIVAAAGAARAQEPPPLLPPPPLPQTQAPPGPAPLPVPAPLPPVDEAMLRALLARFSDAVHARDPKLPHMFTDDCLLIGALAGERAQGAEQINALIMHIYSLPVRISWVWDRVTGGAAGENALWLFAEGAYIADDGVKPQSKPYRLSGIMTRVGGDWQWRLFHGSEPAPG